MVASSFLPEEKHKSAQELYDLIYTGVKEKNKAKIQSALKYAGIHINHGRRFSPAYHLALEGTKEAKDALQFLIATYPNARFILLSLMIWGNAQCGRENEVNEILAEALNHIERSILLTEAMKGYALGGYESQAKRILSQASNPLQHTVFINAMIKGYSLGGFVEKVNNIWTNVTHPEERCVFLNDIAYGFIQNRHDAKLDCFLTQIKSLNAEERFALLEGKAGGYAASGRHDKVNEVLAQARNDKERSTLLNRIGYIYTLTGQPDNAKELLAQPLDEKMRYHLLLMSVSGSIRGGHVSEANHLLAYSNSSKERQQLHNQMLFAYAVTGQFTEAKEIVSHENTRSMLFIKAGAYATAGNVTEVKHILVQTSDWKADDRRYLLVCIVVGYTQGNYFTEASHILLLAGPELLIELLQVIAEYCDKKLFQQDITALYMLASFDPKYQEPLVHTLHKFDKIKEAKVDLMKFIPDAKKINIIMKRLNINFYSACDWIDLELKTWLLQGNQLRKKIPIEIILLIATFLSFHTIENIGDLQRKLFISIKKSIKNPDPFRNESNLQIHIRLKKNGFFDNNKIRKESFRKACTESREEYQKFSNRLRFSSSSRD